MKKILSLASLALLFSSVFAQKGRISIDPKSRQMKDASGRSVIFHGVNVVYKVDPYIPDRNNFDAQLSLTDKELDDLVNWGFNFVRLGVMWEAVERAPGQYNMTYLDDVENLIARLGERGIYTLVDMHQDILARKICGEGLPNFYAVDLPTKCEGGIFPSII
jgi:endoglycosylceramidase